MDEYPVVAVVDDEAGVRDAIAFLLKSVGLEARLYANADDFWRGCDLANVGCIVLDIRMPIVSGLEVQRELLRRGCKIPVVMISGFADVPLAVEVMRLGAVALLEKPFRDQALLDAINEALRRDAVRRATETDYADVAARLKTLTPREREVLDHLIEGATAKETAARMGLSPKTVDFHRAKIMEKMQTHTLVELVNKTRPCLGEPCPGPPF